MGETIAPVLAGAAGVLSHVCFFIRGEHHLNAPYIFRFYLALGICFYLFYWRTLDGCSSCALQASATNLAVYFSSLFSSIFVYRVFFHRIRHFPGPFLAGTSKLYHVSQIRNSDQYLFLERLHQKYGDFVRTGPNEITIFTPKAIPLIHGPNSECTKAAWYDNILPKQAVVTTRSRKAHDIRRRIWDQGFSTKALQQHENKILRHARVLDDVLSKSADVAVNVTALFEYYGFDVMGDVGYNQSFGMLETQKSHYAIDIFKGGVVILGTLTPVPWMIHLLYSLPFLSRGWNNYLSWQEEQVQKRIKNEPLRQDTLGWLLDAARTNVSIQEDHNWLLGDFATLVTGGSEPVVSTIIYLFYHLAASPGEVSKLRLEIKNLSSYSDNITLQSLPHLNGLINETLRLHPPIASGGLRTTPSAGIDLEGIRIPGDTTVLTPHYSLGRREDCFVRAADFIPERWYSQPDLIKDRTAFMPFGVGHYSCVGRNLGLMEIRTVTTLLVDKYDISFAPWDDGTRLHKETLDCFASCAGKLELMFRQRK